MSVIQPYGMLTRRLVPQPLQRLTRLPALTVIARVVSTGRGVSHDRGIAYGKKVGTVFGGVSRAYATAAAGAGRAKAHTGRTTKKRTTKSPGAKKSTAGKKASRKTVTKTKSKTKAKAKPKTKSKKTPSANALKQRGIAVRKELKERALLSEPKKLPISAWQVHFIENKPPKATKLADIPQHTRDVAAKFKTLSPLERERLNHTANENKATNEKNYKQWVTQFQPIQIKEANNARRQLAAQKKDPSTSKKVSVRLIKDDRLVKQPKNPYNYFNVERLASGDFQHLSFKDHSALIAQEWKGLSASAKQKYVDQATQDRARYVEEFKSVYGVDAPPPRPSTRKT